MIRDCVRCFENEKTTKADAATQAQEARELFFKQKKAEIADLGTQILGTPPNGLLVVEWQRRGFSGKRKEPARTENIWLIGDLTWGRLQRPEWGGDDGSRTKVFSQFPSAIRANRTVIDGADRAPVERWLRAYLAVPKLNDG